MGLEPSRPIGREEEGPGIIISKYLSLFLSHAPFVVIVVMIMVAKWKESTREKRETILLPTRPFSSPIETIV